MEGGTHGCRMGAALDQVGEIHGSSLPPPGLARSLIAVARIRVALCQIDPTVGDLDGNVERIVAALSDAEAQGCDLAVFPELAITGYPPEDLLLKPGFIGDNRRALDRVAPASGTCAAVVGVAVSLVGGLPLDLVVAGVLPSSSVTVNLVYGALHTLTGVAGGSGTGDAPPPGVNGKFVCQTTKSAPSTSLSPSKSPGWPAAAATSESTRIACKPA